MHHLAHSLSFTHPGACLLLDANNSNGYNNISKAQKRMSTSSAGQNMTQVSPTTSTSLDLLGRAKSREFLRV